MSDTNKIGTLMIKHLECDGKSALTTLGQRQMQTLLYCLQEQYLPDNGEIAICFDKNSADCKLTAELLGHYINEGGLGSALVEVLDQPAKLLRPNAILQTTISQSGNGVIYIVTQQLLDEFRTIHGVPEENWRDISHGEGYVVPQGSAMRDFKLSQA